MDGRGLEAMESFGELSEEGGPVNATSRISLTSLADQTLPGIAFTVTTIAITVATAGTTASSHAPNWLLGGGDADDGGACKSVRDLIS